MLRLEVQVAEAAVAALGDEDLLAGLQQFGHHLAGFGVVDDGADRHAQDDVVGRRAELVGTPAVLAVARLVAARVAEVDQRVEVAVGHREDAAAPAAVATVRAAERDVLLAAKAHAAVAAVAGGDVDGGFVNEFHDVVKCPQIATVAEAVDAKKKAPAKPGLRQPSLVNRSARASR